MRQQIFILRVWAAEDRLGKNRECGGWILSWRENDLREMKLYCRTKIWLLWGASKPRNREFAEAAVTVTDRAKASIDRDLTIHHPFASDGCLLV